MKRLMVIMICCGFALNALPVFADPLEGMNFVQIPAGNLLMGSPASETDRWDIENQHEVTVNAFEMMTTEVTQAMWMEIMGTTVAHQRELTNPRWEVYGEGPSHPMYYVSWDEVQEFIRRLNERDPGKGYRLPTEAEWEYACRAGTTGRFYTGNEDSDLSEAGWYRDNSGGSDQPVAQKTPNAWGLYDMHGNVSEWCNDFWDREYYSVSPREYPTGPDSGTSHVIRGGSWDNRLDRCRSAARMSMDTGRRYAYLGFRLARDVQE